MASEEIQKFKNAVTEAEAAAKKAVDELIADPENPDKKVAKNEADAKLDAARNALADAESSTNTRLKSDDTSAQIQEYKTRIILLTAYLLTIVFLSIYLLAGFLMAEIDPTEVTKRREEDKCCRSVANTNSANSASSNSDSNVNRTNTNRTNTNSSRPSANANGTNTASVVSPTPVENAPGGAGTPAGGETHDSNPSNSNPEDTAGASPTPTPDLATPEITVPKYIYVRLIGFSTGDVWSSESYVFLVVFFAGILGGTIRALHSLVKHLGLKDFSLYWGWFYVTLPFNGAGLAIVVYFVLRGGFYGGGFGKGLVLNIFSFAALGALTGLFSDNAMEKLKQVAVTLLADVPPKVDNAKDIQDRKDAEK